MSVTLLDLETKVLSLLQKTAGYQGFYTTAKLVEAINDSLDYISARMMQEGNGWMQNIGYITTVANTDSYTLPTGCAIIRTVRFLINEVYVPITLDSQERDAFVKSDVQTQVPCRYRLLGNKIFFNPLPAIVGTNTVQIEYTSYPTELANSNDVVDPQFERGLVHYLKYRCASILTSQNGKPNPDWVRYENEWYKVMEGIITRRNSGPQFIREFAR
jgi:hypothetical protein